MPSSLTAYKIFIASPGGLDEFRQCFRSTVEKHNDADAVRRGALFIPVGWEQTLGGMGRPQHIINSDLKECDFCVLVLKDRWGSPADVAPESRTGTEEEFDLACELHANGGEFMRDVVVFFVAVESDRISDPGKQLAQVLEFRKRIEKEKKLLFHQVEREEDFADVMRRHLASWTHAHEREATGQLGVLPATPENGGGDSESSIVAAVENELEDVDPIAKAAQLVSVARYTEAESILAEQVARNDDPLALIAYAQLLTRLGRRNQSIDALKQAAKLSAEIGSDPHLARSFEALGLALDAIGSGEEGEVAIQRAISLYDKLEDSSGLARLYILSGERRRREADFEQSLELYKSAIDMATKASAASIEADAWIGLGEVYRDQEHFRDALDALEKGVSIRRELGIADSGDVHAALGATLEGLEDDQGADREYRISIDLFRMQGNRAGQADAADHLGQVCVRTGDMDGAEEAFRDSALNFEAIQNIEGAADAYLSLGKVQIGRGSIEQAERSLRTALSLASRQRGTDWTAAQQEIASLLDIAIASGREGPHS